MSLLLAEEDRRTEARLAPLVPLPAVVGRVDGSIVDLSEGGARVRHRSGLAQESRLRFRWEGNAFDDEVSVLSSRLVRIGPDGQPSYESRLRFPNLSEHSMQTLTSTLVSLRDARVRDQLANLRGDEQETETREEAATAYYTCCLTNGQWWRRWSRVAPKPPRNGFVVRNSVAEGEIRKMYQLFATLNDEGRDLMRLFALELR